ncbi:ABC transporter substrate-binding protein (plasmid) [Priestia megaterium]|uniref:ABC transporter substrate-binding protein n=1 Tax=Priestia megaterium TaxID=1404 RepID=UPI003CFD1B68
MRTYSKAVLALLSTLFLVFMAACGSNGDSKEESESNSKAEQAYTVKHAMGKTEIPKTPKRVVVLTNEGTEALLAMGIKPVGAVQSWLGDPWYDHIKDDMKGVQVVGTESEVSIEKIAALKPDLIIGNKMRQEAVYDQLSQIAPTVFSETLRGDWKENFELYAKAVNKEEKGKEVLADFDQHVNDVKEKLGDKVNQEVSVVRFMPGTARIYYTDSFSGVIFKQLGFKRTPEQEKMFKDNSKLGNLAIDVGKEVIPKMDGDVMFYFTYAPKGEDEGVTMEKEWTNDPLWKNLKVSKSGNVHKVSDAVWNTAGGVIAANQMLDELEKIMVSK